MQGDWAVQALHDFTAGDGEVCDCGGTAGAQQPGGHGQVSHEGTHMKPLTSPSPPGSSLASVVYMYCYHTQSLGGAWEQSYLAYSGGYCVI